MSTAYRAIGSRSASLLVGSPLPRLHVSPRRADGRLYIHDRLTGAELLVYTPVLNSQFRAGHRAGRWYVRPSDEVGVTPRSVGFTTAREAVEAIARGAWRLRVIFPEPAEPAPRTVNPARFRVVRDDSAS